MEEKTLLIANGIHEHLTAKRREQEKALREKIRQELAFDERVLELEELSKALADIHIERNKLKLEEDDINNRILELSNSKDYYYTPTPEGAIRNIIEDEYNKRYDIKPVPSVNTIAAKLLLNNEYPFVNPKLTFEEYTKTFEA